MISPMEIQEKEFGKGFKGYKEDEVNEFLDQLTLDLERVLEDNRQLQEENQKLKEELKRFEGSEGAVLQTLEAAKKLMSDISVSAEKRAQILLKNAELDAQLIQREAKEAVDRMNEENAALRDQYSNFREKYRHLLEAELQRFDTLTADLFPNLDIEDLVNPPELTDKKKPAAQNVKQDMSQTMVNIK